jgi:hypothetical protein
MSEEVKEIENLPSGNDLIQRFAEIQNISYEEAKEKIGADTDQEILENIAKFTTEKIKASRPPLNRAQRRALKKKLGSTKYAEMVAAEGGNEIDAISKTAAKLNYIDLIQKLRKLNEEKEKENNENGETAVEDDGPVAS